ncbi:ATP synthase gamma chain [Dirofilaria immitis]
MFPVGLDVCSYFPHFFLFLSAWTKLSGKKAVVTITASHISALFLKRLVVQTIYFSQNTREYLRRNIYERLQRNCLMTICREVGFTDATQVSWKWVRREKVRISEYFMPVYLQCFE